MVAKPADIPVTVTVPPTALRVTWGLLVVHEAVPLAEAENNWVVDPTHTLLTPEIYPTTGSGFTVTVAVEDKLCVQPPSDDCIEISESF